VVSPVRDLRKPGSEEAPPRPPAESVEAHGSELREWTEAIVIAFVLAIVLRTFLIQAYKIPSGSMEPTLLIGDHIMVNKIR
jgi:signal peptidase I